MTTTSNTSNLDEIRRAGLEAIHRELGPVGLIRFLQEFELGSGDYTAERAELVGHLTVKEICDEIEKRQQEVERDQGS